MGRTALDSTTTARLLILEALDDFQTRQGVIGKELESTPSPTGRHAYVLVNTSYGEQAYARTR